MKQVYGTGTYGKEASYAGSYTENGKIQGTIPQYIYNISTNKFTAVTNLAGTFYSNYQLKVMPEIPTTVTKMGYTFYYCENLEKVSKIPESVIKMERTFAQCSNLKTTPLISNKVQNMTGAFSGCRSLNEVTNIPNSVIDLSYTFSACIQLKSIPAIPGNVQNLLCTFGGCIELTGNIVIKDADKITNYKTNGTGSSVLGTFTGTAKEINLQGKGSLEKFKAIAATSSAGNVKVDEANITTE